MAIASPLTSNLCKNEHKTAKCILLCKFHEDMKWPLRKSKLHLKCEIQKRMGSFGNFKEKVATYESNLILYEGRC